MLYILCILSVSLLSYFADKKENKFLLFLIALILSLFCGLRGQGTGVDTVNYFKLLSYIDDVGISAGSDIGFAVITYFMMMYLGSPYYLLVIFAFITNFLIIYRLWDFRERSSFTLMLFIYMTIHYAYTFNIVRQFLAISIIFWGTRYLERSEHIKYIFLNIIASTIHTTSLLGFMLLLIFDSDNRQTKKHFFYIALVAFFIIVGVCFFSENIIKYEGYLTQTNDSIYGMTVLKVICLLLVIISNNIFSNDRFSITKSGKYFHMPKYIPITYAAGLILAALGMKYAFVNRIGFYFLMFEMPFWGQAIRARINAGIYKCIIFFIVGYVLISMYVSGESADSLFNYHTFLSE